MQKIVPFLWYNDNAEEAVAHYTAIFRKSGIEKVVPFTEAGAKAAKRPEGSVMTASFELAGEQFAAINGGPVFKFTPAVSLYVSCETEDEIDRLYGELSPDGSVLMPFQKYPFSEKYCWITDKFGLSWQLNLEQREQKITPALLFINKQAGRAEEAINLYTSIFTDSSIKYMARYEAGEEGIEGAVKHATFSLNGQDFIAMDSHTNGDFSFNEAFSFVVNCETQDELDYFWQKLSEGSDEKAQQCGWLKDRFGVSWQIVPTILAKLLGSADREKSERAMQAMLKMKKLDIEKLQGAYDGN
jgi:predicted 3-demethylubiquinone-9 3-methyltransferase (glyoxalase superfamily)